MAKAAEPPPRIIAEERMADVCELLANAGGDSSPLRDQSDGLAENVIQVAQRHEDATKVRKARVREAAI